MTMFATLTRMAAAATIAAAMTTTALADGYNRYVEVVNSTDAALTHLFVSNSAADYWGSDHLGAYVLAPGQSMVLDFDDGTGHCSFDFRGEFADGETAENYQVNVCTVSTFTFY